MHSDKSAFTLIELLVVITIIVVLLALLTPALDKAIYQAELTTCMTQQRAIASSVTQYALENRRRYPTRIGSGKGYINTSIATQPIDGSPYEDERLLLRPYMDINFLVDPLSEEVNLDETDPTLKSTLSSSYSLYYGWRFTGIPEAVGAKRERLGDAFKFDSQRLRVMVADWDRINAVDVENMGSHPDHGGTRVNLTKQDEPAQDSDGNDLPVGAALLSQVITVWVDRSAYQRPDLDTNAALEDGSVFTATDVAWDEWDSGEGVVKLPEFGNSNAFYVNWYVQVPKQ